MNFGKDPYILCNLATHARGVTRTFFRCRPLLTSLWEYPPVDACPGPDWCISAWNRTSRARAPGVGATGGRTGTGREQAHDLDRSPPARNAGPSGGTEAASVLVLTRQPRTTLAAERPCGRAVIRSVPQLLCGRAVASALLHDRRLAVSYQASPA